MSDMNFICPTCKRATHPTDNEIIEHLAKEIDRYVEVLIERTKELDRTRKALDKAKWWLNEIVENHRFTPISTAEKALADIKTITKGGENE